MSKGPVERPGGTYHTVILSSNVSVKEAGELGCFTGAHGYNAFKSKVLYVDKESYVRAWMDTFLRLSHLYTLVISTRLFCQMLFLQLICPGPAG